MKEKTLTEQERRFAEDNIDCLYDFMKRHRLDTDEYYDVAVFGYLEAVADFHRNRKGREGSFKSEADKKMLTSICDFWKVDGMRRRNLVSVSFDMEVPTRSGNIVRLKDSISDYSDFTEDIERDDIIDRLKARLDVEGRALLDRLVSGYTKSEAAESLGIKEDDAEKKFRFILRLASKENHSPNKYDEIRFA